MPLTFNEFINLPDTEKNLLCWIEPTQRLSVFTLHSGAVYKRTLDKFAISVSQNGVNLSEGASSSLLAGEWWYEISTGVLYVRMSDDSNPSSNVVGVTYRLFYSDGPYNLPYDLSSGADVEYQPYLASTSNISKEIDEEQIGIALETKTNISFSNKDGHFDNIFDVLFWENKRIRIFSYSPRIAVTSSQLIFDGFVTDKTFSVDKIGFSCIDYLTKLNEPINVDRFTESDGSIPDAYLGTPKRRLYGQFKQLQCVPIDAIKNGFTLSGTVTGSEESTSLVGTSTFFLDECSPGDTLKITVNAEKYEYGIQSITDDNNIVLSDEIEVAFAAAEIILVPTRPWRKKNRTWSIAGHKLRAPSTTVSSASEPNRFIVSDISDFEAGDLIKVDGENARILRISGSQITLYANLQAGTPSVSDVVSKEPVSRAFINSREAFINRDFTITNTTESKIVLTNNAELNIAKPKLIIDGSVTFTNASRDVTASGVNLNDLIESRAWVKSDDITHTDWYEVLSVKDDGSGATLRTVYAGSNNTGDFYVKIPDLVNDETLVTVNCTGKEDANGDWKQSASDAVRDMIENDIGLTNINTASFVQSDLDAPYRLSLALPLELTSDPPTIKNAISLVNQSVFGSLTNNSNWEIVYNVLEQEKPETMQAITDFDILKDPVVRTKNQIVRKVNAKYRPFTDINLNENTTEYYEYVNEFVDNLIGVKKELDIDLYLYNQDDAEKMAQRYALFNSMSQSVVMIESKLNFYLTNLNDKVWLKFDRLYKRFGNGDRQKIAIVNKISKNGTRTSLTLNDLGNTFSRVMSIAPDSANDFASASSDETLFNCFIVDNDTELADLSPSTDMEIGTNIIG